MYREAVSEILVFKTNLLHDQDIASIRLQLDTHSSIRQWNVDHSDVDHVLRIEGHLDPSEVIAILKSAGFLCEELPD